jgi:hypothetical protein
MDKIRIKGKNDVSTKRKLKLEILGDDDVIKRTHHFFYDTLDSDKLTLTVGDRVFTLKPNGTLINDKQKK